MPETTRMRLGLTLPLGVGALGDGQPVRWAQIREIARMAEAVGFDSLMAPDHLLFRKSPAGDTMMVNMPEGKTRGVWEGWTILSAVAEATSRIHLGPLVACSSFRNPALLAKMADTLDEVSGGRLILALGAGWHQPEYTAFGYPYDHRVSRFEEALQVIVPLLREGRVDFQGHYYQARDCELQPRGPSRTGPPIVIGAQGPRMMKLVARWADRYDGDYQLSAEPLGAKFAALDAACREVGRDPGRMARGAGTRLAFGDGPGGAVEYEFGGMRMNVRRSSAEEMLASLRGFATAGVEHLTCNVVDPPGARGLERFARVIEALRR
jgi:alkanesulfonate monooxygenase SsuD/methylene tetrahydromethanopterin reductase-like flavin-dependent oxidoreductase (luciferase family)